MLIILDPKRVSVGTAIRDPIYHYGNGKVLDQIIDDFDAIGGINAGGFIDESGAGTGWPPDGITYSDGVCFNPNAAGGVCGLDENGIMYVGYYEYSDTEALGIKEAVSFGPILIAGGEMVDKNSLERGINPRTAIGQREDGAIIMMVVDGRQAYSIGISYADCADILYDYGCVNAINMDGGNSTCMFYKGELVNHPSNPAGGTRYLPDEWIIKK